MNIINQILTDEIACYQNAINRIEDKLNLISFIGSVNNAFIPESLLKIDELKLEKKSLEKHLRILKKG